MRSGFDAVNKRFDKLERKMDHKRIDRLEQHIENLYERLSAVAAVK